ncbi:MAG: hypothetical protein HY298_11570 [Verrucomicrobia bacterium]|nr:hypothetical protein [Verrucomicrobiota bacterium]
MRTHTLLRYFLTAANLAAALALLPPHALAEDKPPSPPNKPSVSAEFKTPGYDLEIVEGQFVQKGKKVTATLANVVDALRERYPKANIVLSPGLANLHVGDLKLRSRNSLGEELEAIRAASGEKFEFTGAGGVGSGASAIDPTTGLPVAIVRPASNEGLFILREPAPTPETARTVEAFNIGPYLQWLRFEWLRENQDAKQAQENREKEIAERLDELKQIVRETVQILHRGTSVEMPSYQFHRGANLLIVTGTREAVDVARKVVNALPGQSGFGGGGSAVLRDAEARLRELRERYTD